MSFGKYEVIGRLSIGGMAEIYRCRLRGLGGFEKSVVVKRIRPDLRSDHAFTEMFLDEARVAACLNHPNIVQTYGIDEEGGLPYIAMEYVPGPTLLQIMRKIAGRELLYYGELARIVAPICRALHYAHHATGPDARPLAIVHRDVSPQNIVVSLDGIPKILDFGVAKAQGRISETSQGVIKGNVLYMAPEQIRGRLIDHRADIFAIGMCLYHATTGHQPFRGASETEMLASRLMGDFAKPREVVREYPPALEKIVLKALELNPAQRFATAEEMAVMLETFAAGPPYDERASSLTDLVRELFPDFDPDASLVPVDPTPPSIVVSGPNAVGGTVSSPRSGSRRLALTLGVSLVLSSAVLVAFMLHRRPATEESAAAPVAAAPEPTAADPVPASPPSASPALVDSRALKAVDAEAEREPEPEPEPDEPPPVRPLPAPPQRPRPPRNEREARKERPERRPDASAPTAAAPTPVDAASITPPAPPPPRPEPPPPSVSPAERRPAASPPPTAAPAPAGPRRSVSVPTPLRLPATYSVRSAPELDKMLRMIEREAVTTGKVPAAVVQGVTRSFGERTRAALAGGATVEIQPKQLYTIIVRAALQGLGRGAIASELRATAP